MIFSWKNLLGATLIIIYGLLLGTASSAQSLVTTDSIPDDLTSDSVSFGFDVGPTENDLDLSVTPQNPGAYEKINLQLSSDYINLSKYQINWFVDGKLITGGIGKQFLSTETKEYGVPTVIIITVKLTDQTIQKKVTISPEDISIIWEAVDAYAPPFYQGKKLPAREALVKVISIPNFTTPQQTGFDPRTGIYGWKRNDLPVPNIGGYGKDSFTFQHNKIRGVEKITVTAQDLAGNHSATKDLVISFYDPKILFYERSPLTGISSPLSKNSISLTGKETTLEAVPYFFSVIKNNPNNLKIDWTMNGQPVAIVDSRNKTSLTIQAPDGNGTATIGMSAENTSKLFQSSLQKIRVVFQK